MPENEESERKKGTVNVKRGLAQMLKGGVIMDVISAEQAKIAEEAGGVAVMALERVPADIRKEGGVARMAQPDKIKEIMEAVSIPVMAKVRIGHYGEADIESIIGEGIDFIDESEVLTPADNEYHIDKNKYKIPFVCGARNLGEALRRIEEGASMIRTKGEAGTGDINQAVYHMRTIRREIALLAGYNEIELYLKGSADKKKTNNYGEVKDFVTWLESRNADSVVKSIANIAGMLKLDNYYKQKGILGLYDELLKFFRENKMPVEALNSLKQRNAEDTIDALVGSYLNLGKYVMNKIKNNFLKEIALEYGVTENLVREVANICYDKRGFNTLPVVNFAAGGIATPADAILMMKLGSDGVFVGSGIFKSAEPKKTAQAIVAATTYWDCPENVIKDWHELGEAMPGISSSELSEQKKMQYRGE